MDLYHQKSLMYGRGEKIWVLSKGGWGNLYLYYVTYDVERGFN